MDLWYLKNKANGQALYYGNGSKCEILKRKNKNNPEVLSQFVGSVCLDSHPILLLWPFMKSALFLGFWDNANVMRWALLQLTLTTKVFFSPKLVIPTSGTVFVFCTAKEDVISKVVHSTTLNWSKGWVLWGTHIKWRFMSHLLIFSFCPEIRMNEQGVKVKVKVASLKSKTMWFLRKGNATLSTSRLFILSQVNDICKQRIA